MKEYNEALECIREAGKATGDTQWAEKQENDLYNALISKI